MPLPSVALRSLALKGLPTHYCLPSIVCMGPLAQLEMKTFIPRVQVKWCQGGSRWVASPRGVEPESGSGSTACSCLGLPVARPSNGRGPGQASLWGCPVPLLPGGPACTQPLVLPAPVAQRCCPQGRLHLGTRNWSLDDDRANGV